MSTNEQGASKRFLDRVRPLKVLTESSYASVFCTIFIINAFLLVALGLSFKNAYDLSGSKESCLFISPESVFNLNVLVSGDWINEMAFIQYPLTVSSVCPSLSNDVQLTYKDSEVFMQTFTPAYSSLNTSFEIKDCTFSTMYKVKYPVFDQETNSHLYEVVNVVEKSEEYTAGYVNVSDSFVNGMSLLDSSNNTIARMENDFESYSFVFTILSNTTELSQSINFMTTFVAKYLMSFQENSCNAFFSVIIWTNFLLTSLIFVFLIVGTIVICTQKDEHSQSHRPNEATYSRLN